MSPALCVSNCRESNSSSPTSIRVRAGEVVIWTPTTGWSFRVAAREITFAPETQPASWADGVKTRREGDAPE